MRDKELKSYMDPAFSDMAWKKMEGVLDREMPIEKKKRRFVVWFWMAAGMALLIAGSIYLFGYGSNISFQNSSNQPVAHESNKKTITPIINTDKETIIETATVENNNVNSKSNKTNSPNSPYISDVPVITTPSKINENVIAPNPDETTQLATLIDDIPVEEAIVIEDSTPEVIIPTVNALSASVNEIATLAFSEVDKNERAYSFPQDAISFPRTSIPKLIQFKGYLTGQSTDFKSLQGYEAGMAMSRRRNKSKWSFSAGTGFQSEIRTLEVQSAGFIQSDNDISDTSSPSTGVQDVEFIGQIFVDIKGIDSEILADPSNGFSPLYSSKSNSSVDLNVQLHYVTFPIKVNYHISPRWSFSAGVTPSIYLSGNITDKKDYLPTARNMDIDPSSSLSAYDQSTSIPIANNRYFYFTSTAIAPAKIKRWKFPVSVGLDYQLTKHFGLTFDYKANLSPIIDKDFIKTDRQRFHFGGYWNF